MHAPFQSAPPSEPDHWLQGTSVNEPVSAPWPEGKKTAAPPVSSQMSKLPWTGTRDGERGERNESKRLNVTVPEAHSSVGEGGGGRSSAIRAMFARALLEQGLSLS